jgi:hypothetical protein
VGPIDGLDGMAKRKIPCPRRELYPGRPAGSLVSALTELPQILRLQYIVLVRVSLVS